jgi:hypothetical protein
VVHDPIAMHSRLRPEPCPLAASWSSREPCLPDGHVKCERPRSTLSFAFASLLPASDRFPHSCCAALAGLQGKTFYHISLSYLRMRPAALGCYTFGKALRFACCVVYGRSSTRCAPACAMRNSASVTVCSPVLWPHSGRHWSGSLRRPVSPLTFLVRRSSEHSASSAAGLSARAGCHDRG